MHNTKRRIIEADFMLCETKAISNKHLLSSKTIDQELSMGPGPMTISIQTGSLPIKTNFVQLLNLLKSQERVAPLLKALVLVTLPRHPFSKL